MNTKNLLRVMVLAVTFAVTCQIQSNAQTWTNKANLLKQGRSFGVAVLNGKIYLAGGYCGGHCELATLDEYDPASDTWINRANMSTVRYTPAAAALNGKLYVMGGYTSPGPPPYPVFSTVEEYDPVGNTWTNRASMNVPRYAHQAVALNGKIYALGGQTTGDVPLASVEEYDPLSDTWSFKANMPTPRVSPGAAVANGKIYVVGGYTNNTEIPNVYEYNPSSNTWTIKAAMPTPRSTLGVAVVNGRIRTLGGQSAGGFIRATVEEYDPTYNVWSVMPDLPSARNECFSALIGDTLYAFGGYDNYTMQALVVPPMLNAYTAIEIEFLTQPGRVYQLKASPDLTTWTNFGAPIPGDGSFWNKAYSTRGSGRLFYRVEFAP